MCWKVAELHVNLNNRCLPQQKELLSVPVDGTPRRTQKELWCTCLQVHISTGELVQELLPRHKIEALVRGVKPLLRSEKYGKALEKLVIEVGLETSSKAHGGGSGGGRAGGDRDGDASALGIIGVIAAFFGCVWVTERNSEENRQRRVVTARLRNLQRDCQVLCSSTPAGLFDLISNKMAKRILNTYCCIICLSLYMHARQ